MRISRTGRIFVAAAILLATVVGWAVLSWPPSRNYRLPDGTTLRVEHVSYGPRDPAFVPSVSRLEDWKEKLASVLPKTWAGKITVKKFAGNGTWWMNANTHSNVNSLNIWITRRDLTNGFANLSAGGMTGMTAELVGDDGCIYPATQHGGVMNRTYGLPSFGWGSQSVMTWFTFEAYPRHQSKIQLRLYDQHSTGTNQSRELQAQFTLLNPAPRGVSAAGWTLEPLPIEKKFGDVSFSLRSLAYKTNWIDGPSNSFPWNHPANPVEIVPRFAVLEHGRQTADWRPVDVGHDFLESQSLVEQPSDWEALDMELTDSSGNIAPEQWNHPASLFLSPREPAWKLTVKFFGSEQSEAASNTVWVIHGVKVPGPAEYTALPYKTNLDGVFIKPVALVGAGETTYYDYADEVKQISPLSSGPDNRSQGQGISEQVVHSERSHISLRFDGLGDDQRLTIRAVAAGKGEYYAQAQTYASYGSAAPGNQISYLHKSTGPYHISWFPIDLPAEVRTVDLYVCVHRARVINFFFKPPPQ